VLVRGKSGTRDVLRGRVDLVDFVERDGVNGRDDRAERYDGDDDPVFDLDAPLSEHGRFGEWNGDGLAGHPGTPGRALEGSRPERFVRGVTLR